jgi:outer membrane receptor protein involved in Fe transport
LPSGLHAHASYGTAFKAPSFNELYYPGFSNPDLRPEEAKTAELGVRGTAVGVRWNLTAYRSDIDQLIAFDVATFLPQNIASAARGGSSRRCLGSKPRTRARERPWPRVAAASGVVRAQHARVARGTRRSRGECAVRRTAV